MASHVPSNTSPKPRDGTAQLGGHNDDSGTTESARKTLLSIMGKPDVFDFPKPLDLIRHTISLINDPSAIVLDSFAGSGTTAHAVLDMNAEDAGGRRFILVQMPYDSKKDQQSKLNVCKKITAERVRRVIRGHRQANTNGRTEQVAGLGGSFTYARVSEQPLLGEYRDLGERLPSYDDIAKYVFYTETSTQWDKAGADKETGKIGEHAGKSYYLLYRPNRKIDWCIDMEFLKTTAKNDPNRNLVVFCEKIWLHRADLREWEQANKKKVRSMLVPFNLK